jgi:hypothetical protein
MTSVTIPIALARIRGAVERVDLPAIDLRHLDAPDLEGLRRDVGRLVADVDVQKDLQRIIGDLDLPAVDLPDLDTLFGRRRAGVGTGTIAVGGLALLGGLAMGVLVAFFLHPAKGPKRRRQLRKRLGRVKRRLLG